MYSKIPIVFLSSYQLDLNRIELKNLNCPIYLKN